MAKLKIFFDDRHVSVKTGEAPLKIAVSHLTKTTYIPFDITLRPDQWDVKREQVVKHPQKRALTEQIEERFETLKAALRKLADEYDMSSLTANEIRDKLIEKTNPDRVDVRDEKNVKAVYTAFKEQKEGQTKALYDTTWRKIEAFEGKNAERLRFEQINADWLMRFQAFLAKTAPSANARAIHLRNLRAVFNFAITNEVTNNYPFRRFKIKNEPTRKRNFKVDTLHEIFFSENIEPWQEKYRDLFKLTFMLIGINFKDLCHLTEIEDGRIEYQRAKTKKLYSIKLEPEAAEIIAKYRGKSYLLNYLDEHASYRTFYQTVSKGLRALRDTLNKQKDFYIDTLTTYWARHSWATIAASLDIPKETIAAALGHSGHTVTDIYIEFDRRKIDAANRRVLNWVLYGIDTTVKVDPTTMRKQDKTDDNKKQRMA